MKAIIISLNNDGTDNGNDIIRLLSTLLSTTETATNRKRILEKEFNIPMTRELNEEVLEMSNFGMAVEMAATERGMEKGMEKGILTSIKNLMETMKWSARQAMKALQIPESEQPHYESML